VLGIDRAAKDVYGLNADKLTIDEQSPAPKKKANQPDTVIAAAVVPQPNEKPAATQPDPRQESALLLVPPVYKWPDQL
jgi:hypothetical protein